MQFIPLAEFLFERHSGLADAMARRTARKLYGSCVEDLEQAARTAVWQAARTYDPTKGPFPPWAWKWVVKALRTETNHLTSHGLTQQTRSYGVRRKRSGGVGKPPTLLPGESGRECLESSPAAPDDGITRYEDREFLEWLVSTLPDQKHKDALQMKVVCRRCWLEGQSTATVAHQMDVSERAVRSLLQQAHVKVEEEVGKWKEKWAS